MDSRVLTAYSGSLLTDVFTNAFTKLIWTIPKEGVRP